MSFEAAFADRNAEILGRTAAANPATMGEIWRSEWKASGLDTMTGVGRPWQEASDELDSAFRSASGETVFDAARRQGVRLPSSSFEARAEAVRQLSGQLDGARFKTVEPYLDIRARAREKAATIERDAAEIGDRTYGLSGHATAFLAGVARQAVDPVNLATLPLGAARGATLLRMLGTEAVIGAGTQAAQEPFIQSGRAELGLEAGLGQAVSNVAQAGIGAAGLAGLMRGAGWLMRSAFAPSEAPLARSSAEPVDLAAAGRTQDPATLLAREPATEMAPGLRADEAAFDGPRLRDALGELQPEDFAAVAHKVERDGLIEAASPVRDSEGRMLHNAGVDLAEGRLESGRLADLDGALATELGEPFAKAVKRGINRAPRLPTLAQYIARNGGLPLTDETRHLGFDKIFVPGGGPLARQSGRSIDGFWNEALIEAGYFRRDADDARVTRKIWEEISEALRNEQAGTKRYSIFDEEEALARDEQRAFQRDRDRDTQAAALDERAADIAAAHREAGLGDIDDQVALYDAAEIMQRGDASDPLDALERAYVRQVMNEELPAVAKSVYALKQESSDAVQRGPAQDGGRASGDGGGSRTEPGSPADAAGKGQDRPLALGDRAAAGGQAAGRADAAVVAPDDPLWAARLADLERDIANDDSFVIYMPTADGSYQPIGLKQHLAEIRSEATAADALKACLGGGSP